MIWIITGIVYLMGLGWALSQDASWYWKLILWIISPIGMLIGLGAMIGDR